MRNSVKNASVWLITFSCPPNCSPTISQLSNWSSPLPSAGRPGREERPDDRLPRSGRVPFLSIMLHPGGATRIPASIGASATPRTLLRKYQAPGPGANPPKVKVTLGITAVQAQHASGSGSNMKCGSASRSATASMALHRIPATPSEWRRDRATLAMLLRWLRVHIPMSD